MAPLIVLIVIVFLLMGRAGITIFQPIGTDLRTALTLVFLVTASAHWGKRRQDDSHCGFRAM